MYIYIYICIGLLFLIGLAAAQVAGKKIKLSRLMINRQKTKSN